MKKFTLYSLSFYALIFILSFTLKAQINPNGGFETGEPGVHSGTEIDGWDLQMGGTSVAEFTIVTDLDFVHSGSQALQIYVTVIGTNAWEPQVINTNYPVQSNTTYTISVWAKTDLDGAQANFTMGSLDPNYNEWGRLDQAVLGVEWQQFTFQATTRDPETEPVGGIPIHFGVAANQSKLPLTFWLDDIEVTTPDGIGNSGDVVSIPNQYSLQQNYPNPFNPTTTIEFTLPVSENIHLVLSDMLGRVVQEIASGNYNAGSHNVIVNLSNLPSGVYFYTLETSSFMNTKKLVLMK